MSETLRDLLDKLAQIDDEMLPEDFDPAQIVGDVKDKIDAIKWRIDQWNTQADNIDENWIKPLKAQQESLRKKAERLKDYLYSQMSQHGYDKLPGKMFRAALQKASPSVDISEEAGPSHMLAYPEFVVQDVSYRWDRKTIKERLQNGTELSFARLRQTRFLKFYTVKGSKDE